MRKGGSRQRGEEMGPRRGYSPHRLPKKVYRQKLARAGGQPGFSGPVGKSLSPAPTSKWGEHFLRIKKNVDLLKRRFPDFFESSFFERYNGNLELLDSGREGTVWVFTVPGDQFRSSHGLEWRHLAVKKYRKHAFGNPENYAKTMNDFGQIYQYLVENKLFEPKFTIFLPQAIAYQGNIFVMRYIGTSKPGSREQLVLAKNLGAGLNEQVKAEFARLWNVLGSYRTLLEPRFKENGIDWVTPDFNFKNIKVVIEDGRIKSVWVFDQFTNIHEGQKDWHFRHGSKMIGSSSSSSSPRR